MGKHGKWIPEIHFPAIKHALSIENVKNFQVEDKNNNQEGGIKKQASQVSINDAKLYLSFVCAPAPFQSPWQNKNPISWEFKQ
jgi:hypothetical protein